MRMKIRNAVLAGAIAAVTATAWATQAPRGNSTFVPAYTVPSAEPATYTAIEERSVTTTTYGEPIAVTETLSPNETLVTTTTETRPVLVTDRTLEREPIVVQERRLTEDERIQAEVMHRIANNPRLSGLVGVESRGSVVRLSGWTRTVGQARHAESDARSVMGVKYVQNEIRPRVGGSV